jgi:hypothetical protein
MVRLIDRIEELATLERDWNTSENAFLVVFGRRRIGKTRLIEEFVKDKDGVKFTADDVNKKIQIDEFRHVLAAYLKDDFLANQNIMDWGALFSYLEKVLDKKKRFYIWLDEFSYLIKSDPSITSTLQKFCDSFLRNSKIVFIVSGSIFGIMSEKVLSHSSPLYGRRTRDLLLNQLPFPYLGEFLPFTFEDKLKCAFTIGGIPEYLLVASKFKSYDDFISKEFFNQQGYFYREPYYLISQEFKEIKTYFSIINAIAYGSTKPTEIANFVGIKGREIYPYLELLINYGFVGRETTALKESNKGTYRIKDNFFDFWFNFVHRNRELIEPGLFKPDKQAMNQYLGKKFEVLIRENARAFLGNYQTVGRWWSGLEEIDIVAFDEKKTEIVFGECTWSEDVNALKYSNELVGKIQSVEWKNKERKESFAFFARSFSKKIDEFEGRKVHCFDLKDFEKIIGKDNKD